MKCTKWITNWLTTISLLGAAACATSGVGPRKVMLDSSGPKPKWAESGKLFWEEDGKYRVKSNQQVRGDQRVQACLDLAQVNAYNVVLTGIEQEIRSTLDSVELSMNENAEAAFAKSSSLGAEAKRKVRGLQMLETYYERAKIGEAERIDCMILGEIRKDAYDALKRLIVDKIEEADPRIKEALLNKHVELIKR